MTRVDEGSALLLRLRFSPVDRAAIQSDLVKPDRIGHDKIGGDRRTPKTIGTDDHWYHRYYRLPTLAIAQYKLHHVACAGTSKPPPQGTKFTLHQLTCLRSVRSPSDALRCEFAVFRLATKSRICASLQSNSCAVMDPRNTS
jgi:hypothetical protein